MALKPGSELWNYFTNIPEEGMAECKLCKQRLRNNRSYNLKLHVNKIHKNRTEIDKHFEINVTDNLAVCRTCDQRLKNRLCNLRLHMRRFHSVEITLSEDKPSQNPSSSPQPYDEDQIQAVLQAAKRKMMEENGNEEKRPTRRLFIRMDRKTIIRNVIGLIVEDGVSPTLFNSKHIEAILRPMCEALSFKRGKDFKIDVVEIEGCLSGIANCLRNSFSNDLDCRLLSIKIDTDLNAAANTFCISAQFIEEAEIKKRVLGVIDLKDNDQLNEDHIKQILYKFNIDSNQIISAFWDNTKPQYNKYVRNSEYFKETQQFASYPDIFIGDIKVEPYIGHVSQLCLLDIFKNPNILQPFLECRSLAKYISDEFNGYHGIFELNNLSIPQIDSPWKAGTTCKMMNDLYEARNLFHTVKFEKLENIEDQFNCTDELWSFIDSFSKSTTYLQKCILKLYNEELHIGDFYAQWLKCKLLTEKMLSTNNTPNNLDTMILTEILNSIENRTKQLLSQDIIVACLYLDPRFPRVLSSSETSSAVEYLKKLWCRAKLYLDDDSEPNDEAAVQLFDEDDEDAFLNEFLSHDLQVKNKESNDVFKKIELLQLPFVVVDTNVLAFLNDHKKNDPEIQVLSSICFAIPATQIYDKVRYSNVYKIEYNSELSSFTLENLLFVRINAQLLDEAIAHLDLIEDGRSNATSEDENSNMAFGVTTQSETVSDTSIPKILPSSSTMASTKLPSEEFI